MPGLESSYENNNKLITFLSCSALSQIKLSQMHVILYNIGEKEIVSKCFNVGRKLLMVKLKIETKTAV